MVYNLGICLHVLRCSNLCRYILTDIDDWYRWLISQSYSNHQQERFCWIFISASIAMNLTWKVTLHAHSSAFPLTKLSSAINRQRFRSLYCATEKEDDDEEEARRRGVLNEGNSRKKGWMSDEKANTIHPHSLHLYPVANNSSFFPSDPHIWLLECLKYAAANLAYPRLNIQWIRAIMNRIGTKIVQRSIISRFYQICV